MPFDLNYHTARLMQQEPYLGIISRKIDKIATTSIPTAGVMFNEHRGCFEMIYNPDFMASLSDAHKMGVLKHEFYHVIFEHVSGRFKPAGALEAKIWNHATDMAINSFLENEMPSKWVQDGREVMPILAGQYPYKDFPKFQTSEWYYASIKSAVDKGMQELAALDMQFDDHSKWGGEGGSSKESQMAQEVMRGLLEEAAREVRRGSSWGNVPEQIQKLINEFLMNASKLDWRDILRAWIGGSQRADKHSTVRKINKKYPKIHSGKRVTRLCNLAVAIDMSGSMSDEWIGMIFSELVGLNQLVSFTIMPFDTEIDPKDVYEWKKGTPVTPKRTRCGGTDLDAPMRYIQKANKRFDGLIIMSDLAAPKPHDTPIRKIFIQPEQAGTPAFDVGNEILLKI